MAPQDYISRAKANKNKSKNKKNPYKPKKAVPRKGTAKKNQKQTAQNTKNKFIGVFTIVLIAGAGVGLWQLKNNPVTKDPIVITKKNEQSATDSTPVPKATVNNKDASEIPSIPDVTWTYVDELQKEKEIVGEYEVKENGPYKMVCGSFKQRSRAETLKANMAFVGIESTIQTALNGSTTWYKVALGPYTKKRMAEKDKHKLKNNKITGCQIWLWR